MPIYQYKCDCGNADEVYSRMAEIDQNRPSCCGEPMQRVLSAPMVIADIQPYKAVAIDKKTGTVPVITSRKEHREFLNRNGFVEVGNEIPKQKPQAKAPNVREELTKVTHQVMSKYR